MQIGIAGFGFVGSAVYSAIIDKENISIYDPKFSYYNDPYELLGTGVVFICVPTPNVNGVLDNSYVDNNLNFLETNNYQGLVVVKSTIHPTYLLNYKLDIVSNPEFLNEHTAIDDFKNQDLVIIGGRIDLAEKLKQIYLNYFDVSIKNFEFLSFEEALIFKYVRNIKIAYEVMFWEFINDTTGNYRKYNKLLSKMPITVKNIRTDGEKGFGGHCLPKDVEAYPKHELTDFLKKYNKRRIENVN